MSVGNRSSTLGNSSCRNRKHKVLKQVIGDDSKWIFGTQSFRTLLPCSKQTSALLSVGLFNALSSRQLQGPVVFDIICGSHFLLSLL